MIIITGAAGFIGSNMITKLNNEGYNDIIIVDDFSNKEKNKNLADKQFTDKINRNEFIEWIDKNHKFIEFIFHMGARTDTTEKDYKVFEKLNLNYSKALWNACVSYGLPVIYASSAATYGNGEHGYHDKHEVIPKLKPLNPYGKSKNEFDKWAIEQEKKPFYWAGLKFFNVYGPNEYHKGRMASVIYHAYNQINDTGKMKLFRSHNPDFMDGEQKRDFIYVKDVIRIMYYLMHYRKKNGIYNIGTGNARTFNDLVNATFEAMEKNPVTEYIDTPKDIRDKYQYFTEARMKKLKKAGYQEPFTSLEDGIREYVKNYLNYKNYH